MSLQLDHIVIAVYDRDAAIQSYTDLGFTVIRGGVHANQATHNALIAFADGTYLELLAPTGQPPLPGIIDFSAMLTAGEGLAGFALRTADVASDHDRLLQAGFSMSTISDGSRQKEDRVMRWRLALIDQGFMPFLIQDITPRNWRIPDDSALVTHPNQVTGIHAVEIGAPDLSALRRRYTLLSGITPDFLIGTEDRTLAHPTLRAIHLTISASDAPSFPPEHTHNVPFRFVS